MAGCSVCGKHCDKVQVVNVTDELFEEIKGRLKTNYYPVEDLFMKTWRLTMCKHCFENFDWRGEERK